MFKNIILGLGLGLLAVAPGPAVAESAASRSEHDAAKIEVLSQGDIAIKEAGHSDLPQLAGEIFSFQTLRPTEAASTYANEQNEEVPTPSESSDFKVISADVDTQLPRNEIVSTSGLKRVKASSELADERTIPRTHKPPASLREAERLEQFDQIWGRFKRQQIHESKQLSNKADSPKATPQAEPELPKPEVDLEPKQQETPSISTEEPPENVEAEQAQEEAETGQPEKTKPKTTLSLGASGIGSEEAALEAAFGFTQGNFEVNATSTSPLSADSAVVDLESKFNISENTALRMAANDLLSDTQTTLDVGIETQVSPRLNTGVTFENLDDVRVNLEAAWQASESVELAFEADDITTEKVVSVEASYTHPGEVFEMSARANNVLRPTRTFDIEASYKIKKWLKSSLNLTDLTNPTVDVGTEFQLSRTTSLELGIEDVLGRQSYRTQLELSF